MATNDSLEDPKEASASAFMLHAEIAFVCFYGIEIILKIFVHRSFFFCNEDWRWNVFDLFLVITSTFDMAMTLIVGDSGIANVTFMRSQRILKMNKLLRAFRWVQAFSELRMIINSLLGSFISLFWSFLVLIFLLYIFSLIIGLAGQLRFCAESHAVVIGLYDQWGELDRPFNTLEKTGFLNPALFVFFVVFSQVSVLNILTGVFVENAMKHAQPGRDERSIEECNKMIEVSRELRKECEMMDANGSGTVSLEEFSLHLHKPRLQAKMALLGLNVQDAEMFFRLLAHMSDDEEVVISDFGMDVVN
eukprot:CAMPEP_0180571736 /NCGR_PEP_ID=MMETSP1037_2-20121125/8875_1 /TAXON_ID=632150 /ORGANISM="Azadinium spinosum, Strain 3D9" /LENGTH=304 /DNA_ID=CAMNT_0022589067 /DNA_START=33 /DNA_END=949 /DNA_ORIENTATION=-